MLRMGIVESDERFDGTLNNGLVEDGEYDFFGNLELPTDDLLNFELLEKDGVIGDWDACEWKIPQPSSLDDFTPIEENPDVKQMLNYVQEVSHSNIYKTAEYQNDPSYVFHPTSPVSELESSGSCSATKYVSVKSNVAVPVRARSKRARRPSSHVTKWSAAAPFPAPTSRKKKKINKRTSRTSVAVTKDLQSAPVGTKKCTHCEITKTVQWREGPNGPQTLCNACGVRYRSGRLFPEYRPAASPTFVPELHSNSHKKVVLMRNRANRFSTKIEEPFVCPELDFHPVSSYVLDF